MAATFRGTVVRSPWRRTLGVPWSRVIRAMTARSLPGTATLDPVGTRSGAPDGRHAAGAKPLVDVMWPRR